MVRIFKKFLQINNIVYFFRKHSKLSYVHNIGEEPLKPLTVGQLLEKTCAEHSNTLALISCHQNRKLDYQGLLDEADRLAGGLIKLGFQKGDKIGLWAPNMVEWYVTFMACARGGFIMVPLNPFYQKQELEYSINKADINVLITREENLKNQNFTKIIQAMCPEICDGKPMRMNSRNVPSLRNVIIIGKRELRGAHTYNEVLDMADEEIIKGVKNMQKFIKMDDPCCIQFSSGTSGQPKAPVVSHFSIVNNAYFIGKRNKFGQKQHRLCIQNPLFHAYGSVIGLVAALNFGTTAVLPSDSHNVESNLEAIKTQKCTIVYGTPTMYVDLINLQKIRKENLHLEIALCGGAACSPSLFEDMFNVLGVKEVKSVYGLTEITGSTFHSLDGDDQYKCTRTVGYLQEHLEAKVVDPEGNIVERGTPGELCVRGYSVMLNYYKDEEKNKASLEDSGWFHTGDLFIINDDGYGEIVGRLKDIIIRGGENIYPKEIEDYLITHPDIIEAYVVGLPHKRLGEEVCACLRTIDNQPLDVQDIKKFCHGKIAAYKIPSQVKIFSTFPQTISGKIQKYKLVNLLMNE